MTLIFLLVFRKGLAGLAEPSFYCCAAGAKFGGRGSRRGSVNLCGFEIEADTEF